MSLDWAKIDGLPEYVRAAMGALRFDSPDYSSLTCLDAEQWRLLMRWLDRERMTPLFGHVCRGRLPDDVDRRIEANLRANRRRLERLRQEYVAIADVLETANVPHRVLKGFSHGPPFVPAPDLRPQYDLDILVAPERLAAAISALRALGFETAAQREAAPADHAAPLVRRTGWQWRGDYFDADIPTVVELHHRLWDPETEGFVIEALADPAFEPGGSPVYAAAHALRHLLRGSLTTLHVYELAHWLEHGGGEEPKGGVDPALVVVFELAGRWFGCATPDWHERRTAALPAPMRAWLARYAASPLVRQFRPNKDELWLHLELVSDRRTRLRVARRRLLPMRPPGALEGQYERTRPTLITRLRRALRYAAYAGSRLEFHVASVARTAAEAARWSKFRRELSS